MTIEPVPGRKVPYPDDSGRVVMTRVKVPNTSYWAARVRHGDVVQIPEQGE